jgi:UDP-perosamine 4-acetyltransferase
VLDILLDRSENVAGYCDPSRAIGEIIVDTQCLGGDEALAELFEKGVRRAIVALGDNNLRSKIASRLRNEGFDLINAIHPSARLSRFAKLGSGIAVMAGAVVNADTVICDDVIVNTSTSVDHDCLIEVGAHIAPGSHLSGFVTIGKRVLIGVGSAIGRGQTLRIGDDSIIGTGSVVVHDVPPNSILAGNPARPIGRRTHA